MLGSTHGLHSWADLLFYVDKHKHIQHSPVIARLRDGTNAPTAAADATWNTGVLARLEVDRRYEFLPALIARFSSCVLTTPAVHPAIECCAWCLTRAARVQ